MIANTRERHLISLLDISSLLLAIKSIVVILSYAVGDLKLSFSFAPAWPIVIRFCDLNCIHLYGRRA